MLEAWFIARQHEAPAFSGGVLDSWPALIADGLAVCQSEEHAVFDFKRFEEE